MTKRALTCLLPLGLAACEPAEVDSKEPPGALEYEGTVYHAHRLERRVDVLSADDSEPPRCGILTAQALADLTSTIESLDPDTDYDYALVDEPCPYTDAPGALIHIEGFHHSPFACDELCCHPELAPVPRMYFHVFNNLHDTVIEVDGEPYLALDVDQACP